MAISMTTQWFIGHYISAEVFGQYGIFLSVVSTLSMVFLSWPDGATFRIAREEFIKWDRIGETIYSRFALFLFCFLILIVCFPFFSLLPERFIEKFLFLKSITGIILIGIFITGLVQATIYINQSIGNLIPAGVNSLFINIVFFACLFIIHLSLKSYDYRYLGYSFVIANGIVLFFNLFNIPKKAFSHFQYNRQVLGKISFYSLMVPFGIFSVITIQWVDTWFIQYYMNSTKVGIYYWAYQMTVIGLVLFTPLVTILSPKILEAYLKNDKKSVEEYIEQIPTALALLSLVGAIGYCFVWYVVQALSVGEFQESYNTIIILLAAIPFNLLATLVTPVNAVKLEIISKTVYISIATAAINILLDWLLIPIYGMEGAASATSFSFFFAALSQFILMKYYFSEYNKNSPYEIILPLSSYLLVCILFSVLDKNLAILLTIGLIILLFFVYKKFNILSIEKIKKFYNYL